MNWATPVILILCALNLLSLLGLCLLIRFKVYPLWAFAFNPKPVTTTGVSHPADSSKDNGSVILLTPEHDSKVLGDEDAG